MDSAPTAATATGLANMLQAELELKHPRTPRAKKDAATHSQPRTLAWPMSSALALKGFRI